MGGDSVEERNRKKLQEEKFKTPGWLYTKESLRNFLTLVDRLEKATLN